jgi:hypothetical protein
MNAHQVVRRLRAFQAGQPLPLGETLHFPIARDEDLLILAFVRMGGESAPWGIGWTRPGSRPRALTTPEARNRDLVAGLVAEWAPTLLRHLRHPKHGSDAIDGPKHKKPLRQVWLPNPSHLEMLHYLAYTYTRTKWGDPARAALLNRVGRACNWLFREAHRPGQVTVMVGTEALRESFSFPATDLRQGHLGFLLAWLQEEGDREARMKAAAKQEQRPIATTLDPAVERDELQPRVDQWNEAFRGGQEGAATRVANELRESLEPELLRRLHLTEQTIGLLRRDGRRVNRGVEILEDLAREEHWYQYLRLEHRLNDEQDGPAFIPSPETDRHPSAAAARFFIHEDCEAIRYNALIHDDREIQEDAIASGDAFRAMVVRIEDRGSGTKTIPIWTLEGSDLAPLRLREGSEVCVAGIPKRKGELLSVALSEPGKRRYVVAITGWKTENRLPDGTLVPHATDRSLKGREVVLVTAAYTGLARRKSQRVWRKDVPGAWLTHALPTGLDVDLPRRVSDDLRQIAKALAEA